jgi:hypothetical protein
VKRCCTCHQWKQFEECNRRASSRDGLQPRCRSCSRSWYEANNQEHKANIRKRTEAVKRDNWELMRQYLRDHPCVDCGEKDLRVLDFDHRPGGHKATDVGRLVGTGYSWKVILLEIAKCDVRWLQLSPHCHL